MIKSKRSWYFSLRSFAELFHNCSSIPILANMGHFCRHYCFLQLSEARSPCHSATINLSWLKSFFGFFSNLTKVLSLLPALIFAASHVQPFSFSLIRTLPLFIFQCRSQAQHDSGKNSPFCTSFQESKEELAISSSYCSKLCLDFG